MSLVSKAKKDRKKRNGKVSLPGGGMSAVAGWRGLWERINGSLGAGKACFALVGLTMVLMTYPALAFDVKGMHGGFAAAGVHGEPVVTNKVMKNEFGGGATVDLLRSDGGADHGLYAGMDVGIIGLKTWKKNPLNGWKAITAHNPMQVDEWDPVYAYIAGWDFKGPAFFQVEHTNYPDRTVSEGRYSTVFRWGFQIGTVYR